MAEIGLSKKDFRSAKKVKTAGELAKDIKGIGDIKVKRFILREMILLALADHLGIPREATLAVGDSENDRAMLEKAGVAAVMANGMEQIRKLADIVSENDNNHDGVAEIFARLGL